jgi:hypothetical protein
VKLHQSSLVDAMTAICINAPELLLWKVVSGYGDIIQHQVSVGQGVSVLHTQHRYHSHTRNGMEIQIEPNHYKSNRTTTDRSEPLQIDPIASLRRQSEIFGSTPSTSKYQPSTYQHQPSDTQTDHPQHCRVHTMHACMHADNQPRPTGSSKRSSGNQTKLPSHRRAILSQRSMK